MRKINYLAFLLVFSLASNLVFSASSPSNKTKNQIQNQVQNQIQNQVQTQSQIQQVQNQLPEPTPQPSPEELNKEKWGQFNAQMHRSRVANFVQELLQTADRLGGLGEEVRNIAKEQNQAATTTLQLMERIQNRNRIKTFLFGTDYKNLGELRSQWVKMRNRIEQLKRLVERITNEGDKTLIQNQIKVLEEEQAKIEQFLKEKENQFSLFGWVRKIFNK